MSAFRIEFAWTKKFNFLLIKFNSLNYSFDNQHIADRNFDNEKGFWIRILKMHIKIHVLKDARYIIKYKND